jgi:hypothetical protein
MTEVCYICGEDDDDELDRRFEHQGGWRQRHVCDVNTGLKYICVCNPWSTDMFCSRCVANFDEYTLVTGDDVHDYTRERFDRYKQLITETDQDEVNRWWGIRPLRCAYCRKTDENVERDYNMMGEYGYKHHDFCKDTVCRKRYIGCVEFIEEITEKKNPSVIKPGWVLRCDYCYEKDKDGSVVRFQMPENYEHQYFCKSRNCRQKFVDCFELCHTFIRKCTLKEREERRQQELESGIDYCELLVCGYCGTKDIDVHHYSMPRNCNAKQHFCQFKDCRKLYIASVQKWMRN